MTAAPDFGSNPFNGPRPTYDQLLQLSCNSPAQAANFAAWRARGFTGTAPCFQRSVTIEIPFGAHDTCTATWRPSACSDSSAR